MNEFALEGTDPTRLIDHLAFFGLANILCEQGVTEVRMRWDGDVPVLSGPTVDAERVEAAVREHAAAREWVAATHDGRGTMSPRITTPSTDEQWEQLAAARRRVLDGLAQSASWSDLLYIAALGEPSYWRYDFRGKDRRPDEGASRWDMQPRNQGSELIGTKMAKVRDKLARRVSGSIAEGLSGRTTRDDLAGDSARGLSATGLAVPGPVDTAVVWCALWGIGNFPVAQRVRSRAVTAGCSELRRATAFHVPAWVDEIRPARLRTILRSAQLAAVGGHLAGRSLNTGGSSLPSTDEAWLLDRGVEGIYIFPVGVFGSDNSPERRALEGRPMRVGSQT